MVGLSARTWTLIIHLLKLFEDESQQILFQLSRSHPCGKNMEEGNAIEYNYSLKNQVFELCDSYFVKGSPTIEAHCLRFWNLYRCRSIYLHIYRGVRWNVLKHLEKCLSLSLILILNELLELHINRHRYALIGLFIDILITKSPS